MMRKGKEVERELKISFESKEVITCPICTASFHREELLSGGGRMIAGALTDELHRIYEPSVKYGDVYPLAYMPTVCPECWFASSDKDFSAIPAASHKLAQNDRDKRMADTRKIFPYLDFHENRDLESGAASHYLVLRCYDFFPKSFSPTIKQGIAALRTGWLLEEMDKKNPGQHYDWLAMLLKKKALFFYEEAIKKEQSGKEPLSGVKFFGPDMDKNYAYEGVLYLASLLKYKYGYMDEPELRVPALGEAKRTIARLFGVGKKTKSKPGPLLEHARELYDKLSKELNEFDD